MAKRSLQFIATAFLVTLVLAFSAPPQKTVRTIIIDPGHGGADPGAAGLISTEAQLTLQMAKRLGKRIEKEFPDVKVLFTRTEDVFPGNAPTKKDGDRYRASFANKSGADLFISLHCNSSGHKPGGWYEKRVVGYDEKKVTTGKGKKKRTKTQKIPIYESFYVPNVAKGTETFIYAAREAGHKTQMVGESGEFGDGEDSLTTAPENDPVINALKLVYTKKYFLNSLRLAEMVQQEFIRAGRVNRGVKQRNDVGIWVLHATGMPSILVETGFITNKEEEEYMNSEAGQEEVAANVTEAVKQYIAALNAPKKEVPVTETAEKSVAALLPKKMKKSVGV